MDFQSYFPVWNKLTPAQQERILGSLMERRVSKGTVIHNGSMDCTGLLLVKSGQLRATGLLGLWGFVGGAALLFLVLVSNRTISGQCYLYPLVPFNGGELKKKLLRIGGGPPERKGA